MDRKSQGLFERDVHLPGAAYLLAVAALGIDVNYVMLGLAGARDQVESELLQRFRASSRDVQDTVLRALGIPVASRPTTTVSISGGEQGQVVAGNVSQRGVTFNVGGKKKGARE